MGLYGTSADAILVIFMIDEKNKVNAEKCPEVKILYFTFLKFLIFIKFNLLLLSNRN